MEVHSSPFLLINASGHMHFPLIVWFPNHISLVPLLQGTVMNVQPLPNKEYIYMVKKITSIGL